MPESKVSIEIVEAKSSNVARRGFAIHIKNADGSPAAGGSIEITLDGPGSLAYAFSAKDQRREADAICSGDLARRHGVVRRDRAGDGEHQLQPAAEEAAYLAASRSHP